MPWATQFPRPLGLKQWHRSILDWLAVTTMPTAQRLDAMLRSYRVCRACGRDKGPAEHMNAGVICTWCFKVRTDITPWKYQRRCSLIDFLITARSSVPRYHSPQTCPPPVTTVKLSPAARRWGRKLLASNGEIPCRAKTPAVSELLTALCQRQIIAYWNRRQRVLVVVGKLNLAG